MRKMLIIAKREYRAMVATKAFVITLVLMPVLMGGGIFFQERLRQRVDLDEKRIVVLDGPARCSMRWRKPPRTATRRRSSISRPARRLKPCYRLEQGPGGQVTDEERLELSERIRRGEISCLCGDSRGRLRHFVSGGGGRR